MQGRAEPAQLLHGALLLHHSTFTPVVGMQFTFMYFISPIIPVP